MAIISKYMYSAAKVKHNTWDLLINLLQQNIGVAISSYHDTIYAFYKLLYTEWSQKAIHWVISMYDHRLKNGVLKI